MEDLLKALEPFAKFNEACKFMGGNFPKTGAVYSVNSGFEYGAEITREDFLEAALMYDKYKRQLTTGST